MKLFSATFIAIALAVTSSFAELKVGDDAPDFKLKGSDGKTYELSKLKGKKVECQSLRESGKEIKKFAVEYFTASNCSESDAKKFAEKLELDYPILADEKSEAAEAYGVVTKLRRFPHRHTFYISKEGKILAIDKDVNTKTAGKDIAEKLKELKIDKK